MQTYKLTLVNSRENHPYSNKVYELTENEAQANPKDIIDNYVGLQDSIKLVKVIDGDEILIWTAFKPFGYYDFDIKCY